MKGSSQRSPLQVLAAFLVLSLTGLLWLGLAWHLGFRAPDFCWHLATGRWIVESGAVPSADPFCYTSEGLPWTNLNWLAQAAFYRVYQACGFAGLEALRLLLLSATLAFTWLNLRARRISPLWGLVVLALSAWALLWVTALRPRLFTMALLSGFAWLLARPDPEDRLGLWPGLALGLGLLLWNHLHGGFVYGYCLLGTDALGTAISSGRRGQGWLPLRSRWGFGIVSLGLCSFLLHPHGLAALWHVANYNARLGPLVISETLELLPLDFGSQIGAYFLGGLALALVGCVWGERPRLREVLVALPFLYLSLKMVRGVNPLVIVALPWVAQACQPLWRKLPALTRLDRLFALAWRPWGLQLGLVALCSTLGHLPQAGPGAPNDVTAPAWRELPTAAVAAIRRVGGEGRVFNRWPDGGPLVWGLYPQRRTFGDGRGDFHGVGSSVREGHEIAELQPGWHARLLAWEVEFALLARGTPLARALAERPEWQTIHADEGWVVLQRDLGAR